MWEARTGMGKKIADKEIYMQNNNIANGKFCYTTN